MLNPWWLIRICWIATIGFWVLKARGNKPTVRAQGDRGRVVHSGAAISAFLLALVGPNASAFQPSGAMVWLGAMVTILGCVFAAIARRQLGANWSPHASVKREQELLETGVYGLSRHPIYTGLLTALGGTALASGKWRLLAALAILGTSFVYKARAEESLMLSQFGTRYRHYQERVKFLVPGLW